MFSAIALISKYVTKGWKEVQVCYADKENSEEVAKVLSYLEVVEKVKHSCDETEVINLIEEHKLEREQLLTDHLKSKLVSVCVLFCKIIVQCWDLMHSTYIQLLENFFVFKLMINSS